MVRPEHIVCENANQTKQQYCCINTDRISYLLCKIAFTNVVKQKLVSSLTMNDPEMKKFNFNFFCFVPFS